MKEFILGFFKALPTIIKDTITDFKIELNQPNGFWYIILGLFWVGFYIFIRFFRDFTGYNIIEFKDNINSITLFWFILFTVINFLVIFCLCVVWYKKKYNKPTSKYILKFANHAEVFIDKFFWAPLYTLYRIIEKNILFGALTFEFLEYHFFVSPWLRVGPVSFKQHYLTYLSIIVLDILPKLIPACIFFVEVVFFSKVEYFLYFLPLLFVPVLFKLFLNLMKSYGYNNSLPILEEYTIRVVFINSTLIYETFKIYETYEIELRPEYEDTVCMKRVLDKSLRFLNMLMQEYLVQQEMSKFKTITTFLTSLLYFIAGLVRVLIIFNCF